MREYAFPSGRELTPSPAIDPSWLWHVGLAAMLVLVITVLIVRMRRPARGSDVVLWLGAIAADWFLARWMDRNLIGREALLFYCLAAFLVAVVAIIVTAWRSLKEPGLRYVTTFLLAAGVVMIFLLPAVQQSREAARRTQCKNQLKIIGLGLQCYVDFHGQYPYAGRVISDSAQICSWRMTTWSYMEAIPFHEIYHFEEPWDSPFNRRCLDRFEHHSPWRCPTHDAPARFTDYAMLTGPGTIGGDGMTTLTPADVTDGLSNTIFIVEASGRKILFTEPKDIEVTEQSLGVNLPGDQLGHSRGIISSYHVGGGHVLLGDGTVRYISEKIDPAVLKALTTINGGETVPEF